jgi:hypothetical protein
LKGGQVMRHSVLAFLAFFVVVPALAQAPNAATNGTPTTSERAWTPPRAPDGHPDLQGVWLNNGATPLERPKALEGRQSLTDEEVAELKRRAARLFDESGNSDFAGGDNFFLALLENPEHYRNPNVTGGSDAMIEREFDSRTSLIVDPPDGRIPPFTAEGRERNARSPSPTGAEQRLPSDPEALSNALRCITYGVPRLGVNNISGAGPMGYYQIVQAPGYVVLTLEAIHEARIIPLDGRPHLPESIRKWSGDSRGRWDGDTLVVDTSNFTPSSNFMGSAESLHLVERFTRVAPDVINYEITIDDPRTWTRPWTAVIRLRQRADRILEYACHEGNFEVMRGILAGARAKEKAAEEKVK